MSDRVSRRDVSLWNVVVILFVLLLMPLTAAASPRGAQEEPPMTPVVETAVSPVETALPPEESLAATLQPAVATAQLYFPYVTRGPTPPQRIGYNVLDTNIARYPDAYQLDGGWYLNWSVQISPLRPRGMEFVQTIRVHQKLTCPLWSADAWNRDVCPYAQPYDYIIHPAWTTIAAAARANPGALWLIGNEMDRRDWKVNSVPPSTSGQDETLPETYAVAYHDLYSLIKSVDPSAQVAIGGVIQPTPQRLTYLSRVWDAYLSKYGTTMPVDVWNIHNFILPEHEDGRGAGVPPGISGDGIIYKSSLKHVDMEIFGQQIRAFRGWMKDRGQQNKPLIVSEYGVLYPEWYQSAFDAERVGNFMIDTFDYYLNTTDCQLGMSSDGCRLVQRWAWYSLDDDGAWSGSGLNEYGALFNRNTTRITDTGVRYRDWVAAHRGALN